MDCRPKDIYPEALQPRLESTSQRLGFPRENLAVDEMAVLLQAWATQHNVVFKLGYVMATGVPHLARIPGQPDNIIWVRSSAFSVTDENTINHWEGLRPAPEQPGHRSKLSHGSSRRMIGLSYCPNTTLPVVARSIRISARQMLLYHPFKVSVSGVLTVEG